MRLEAFFLDRGESYEKKESEGERLGKYRPHLQDVTRAAPVVDRQSRAVSQAGPSSACQSVCCASLQLSARLGASEPQRRGPAAGWRAGQSQRAPLMADRRRVFGVRMHDWGSASGGVFGSLPPPAPRLRA